MAIILKPLICLLMISMSFASDDQKDYIIDHPVEGELFDISEEDMLDMLMRRLHQAKEDGKLEDIENKMKERVQQSALYPKSLDLRACTRERIYYVDPSLTITEDIKDHEGKMIVAAGTKINPLDHMNLSKGLLFIDGTIEDQVDYAIRNQEKFHVLLTKGSPILLGEKHQQKFYFDQNGLSVKRYGIEHVPASLEQEGKRLKITEFVLPQQEGVKE